MQTNQPQQLFWRHGGIKFYPHTPSIELQGFTIPEALMIFLY